ncbi:hypothetical protein MZO42_11685 [Sphingomonas psychrotolerans]|uniref:DNA binding HTH domain-containing protein n=1 Tax=Sphingomonas psychrotolerans TaxID=1327635 RepID=A0ABU3N4A2_9SPHN|nr:hypothetical protein [Sphingomonas psychrotolerans]MDT8759359.1 hypothetical protein [Sphingomonas psychrotolerans]
MSDSQPRHRREVPGRGRWCYDIAETFLLALSRTGNVRAAARAINYTTPTLYWRRQRYPMFARAWDFALEEGRARAAARYLARLEFQVPFDGEREGDPYPTVDQALQQLRLHRHSVRGGKPQRYDHRAKPANIEKVRASILRKIRAIELVDAWRKVPGFDV